MGVIMEQRTANQTRKPIVKLVAATFGVGKTNHVKVGPEELSAFGALGCFEEKTPTQLRESIIKKIKSFEEVKALEKIKASAPEETKKRIDKMIDLMIRDEIDQKIENVINESAGRGHGSVLDQNAFVFEIEDLTRAATLQLCLPQYLAHLQQSLRRTNANRGYYLPPAVMESKESKLAIETLDAAFALCGEMVAAGIPEEDARYILPLYTRTNIQTIGNARELTHLHAMSEQWQVPSAVKGVVEAMIAEASAIAPKLFKRRETNYERLAWYPSAQLYSENMTMARIVDLTGNPERTKFILFHPNKEDIIRAVSNRDEAELANLKHMHNGGQIEGFLVPVSLAGFHQAIRQRTWDQSVESIFGAAIRGESVTPETIKRSPLAGKYSEQAKRMFILYVRLVASGASVGEAVGVIPHSTKLYDLIHVNGWNAIHSIGKRTCTEAQREIRVVANDIAAILKERGPAMADVIGPQGDVYGRCPERKPCGLCKKASNVQKKGEETA
jgi:thymidylate synthase (FAD)